REQAHSGKLRRTMTAVVNGMPGEPGATATINRKILEHADGRVVAIADTNPTRAELNRSRDAVTRYQVVRTDGERSVLRLRCDAPRRRQYLAHLRAIGAPIAGDPGEQTTRRRRPPPRGADRGPKLALHGSEIVFQHPADGAPMRFQLDPPEAMLRLVSEHRLPRASSPTPATAARPSAGPPVSEPTAKPSSLPVPTAPPPPAAPEPETLSISELANTTTPEPPPPTATPSTPTTSTETQPAPDPPAAPEDDTAKTTIQPTGDTQATPQATPQETPETPSHVTPSTSTPAPATVEPEVDRGWDHVARWYDELTEDRGGDLYEQVILPGTERMLGDLTHRAVLDIACGQGVLARRLHEQGARVVGVDAGPQLIDAARRRSPSAIEYHVADARKLGSLGLKAGSFDAAACVMAWMNIDPLGAAMRSAAALLRPGAPLVSVIIHPAFRAPKATAWAWRDRPELRQVREVESYLTPRQIAITMNPGAVSGGAQPVHTWTFHRPVGDYVRELAESGFWVDAIEEWSSSRTSQPGPRAEEENRARAEIPMFMAIRAIRRSAP
ncbi:MAG: methyltransferase domain-containing protein, partial [Planctomycetota bacterium]